MQNQINKTTEETGYHGINHAEEENEYNNIEQFVQVAVANQHVVDAMTEMSKNLQQQVMQMAEQNQQLQQLVYMALNANGQAVANEATTFPPSPVHNPYLPQFCRQLPLPQPMSQLVPTTPLPQVRAPCERGCGRIPRRMMGHGHNNRCGWQFNMASQQPL